MTVGRRRRSFRKSPLENWLVLVQPDEVFCNVYTDRILASRKGYCARRARGDGGLPRKLCEYPHHDKRHLRSRRGRIGADRAEYEQLFNIAQRPDAGVRENVEGRSQGCYRAPPAPAHIFFGFSSRTMRSALSRDGSIRVRARTCLFSNRPIKRPTRRATSTPPRRCPRCLVQDQRSACLTRR